MCGNVTFRLNFVNCDDSMFTDKKPVRMTGNVYTVITLGKTQREGFVDIEYEIFSPAY